MLLMTLLVTPHGMDGNFNLDLERNLDPLLISTMRSYDDAERQWGWSFSMDCHRGWMTKKPSSCRLFLILFQINAIRLLQNSNKFKLN